MIPSSFDAGNPETDEDFSLRVLIIRLTASSNLAFALEIHSAAGSSKMTFLVDAEAGTALNAAEADAGFLGCRFDASTSRLRRNTSRSPSNALRNTPALVLANAELGFCTCRLAGNDFELSLYTVLRAS